MDKKELEKLRTLNATKSMIDALRMPGEKKDWTNKVYEHRCRLAARCQQLNGILKISICTREDVDNGILTPKWDIFINYEGDSYITRERQKDGTYKWRAAMVHNLEESGCWYPRKYDVYMYFSAENKRTIKTLLGTKSTGSAGIMEWQKGCRRRLEDRRLKKYTDQWDKEMEPVKEPPKGFKDWYEHNGFDGYNFIYYAGAGAEEGYCTSCLAMVKLDASPKHNMPGKCPACKKKVNYISRAKKKNDIWTGYRWVSCIQKYKDGLVQREFCIRRVDSRDAGSVNKCRFFVEEIYRTTIQDSTSRVYEYGDYKRRGKRWYLSERQNIDSSTGKVYHKNLAQLFRSCHTSYPIAARNGYMGNIAYFLAREKKYPVIEMCFKAGLMKLGKEFLYDYRYQKIKIDTKEHELGKMLGIDRARLQRLKSMDGGITHLLWLQKEKKDNTMYQDADILNLNEAGLEPDDTRRKNPFTYLSIHKICNYLRRQQEYRKEAGRTGTTGMRYIWSDWCDYVDMMQKLKMDCTKELLLKPKDLTMAHNELVARISLKNSEKEIRRMEKKFKKAQELMQSGELKKYEYNDGTYCIVAPAGIKDIYEEGITLKHCIHTCDIYFQRMDIRETYLLFLRKADAADTPWYTLEIEPGGNIRQKKSVLNEAYKDLDGAMPFLKKWQQWVKENLSEEDKKLAEKSDKARKDGYQQLREEKKTIWHGRLQGTLLADALESDFMEAM